MEYRNKVTGSVIDVNSVIGGDWEPVAKKAEKATETEKKETKSKGKASK